MTFKPTFTHLLIAGSAVLAAIPAAFADVTLLEPVNGTTVVSAGAGGLGTLENYFNLLYPWMVGLAAGTALLMALFGGVQVIFSGGDPGQRGAGISRILWAIGGLLLLAFSTLILRILNPSFYKL